MSRQLTGIVVLIENALNAAQQFMKALCVAIRNAGRAAPETGRSLVQCRLTQGNCRKSSVIKRLLKCSHLDNWVENHRNRSAVGTLVERTTRLMILAKVDGTTATAAAVDFSNKLNEVPRSLRLSMTYDQSKEMVKHAEITQKTGIAVYFADPYSPCQRGSNENTNGLLRQYLPKGTDLSAYSQEELDKIADSLNTRPRKTLDWRTPLEVYAEVLKKSITVPSTLQ